MLHSLLYIKHKHSTAAVLKFTVYLPSFHSENLYPLSCLLVSDSALCTETYFMGEHSKS